MKDRKKENRNRKKGEKDKQREIKVKEKQMQKIRRVILIKKVKRLRNIRIKYKKKERQ